MVTADWSKKTSDVPEGARRQWRADRALRPPMRSPEGGIGDAHSRSSRRGIPSRVLVSMATGPKLRPLLGGNWISGSSASPVERQPYRLNSQTTCISDDSPVSSIAPCSASAKSVN
ncbi:MAG: hypothetical protein JW395_4128 [Nitrospira sp.]|nr:hypothetical protein [Nitrospira sp.]